MKWEYKVIENLKIIEDTNEERTKNDYSIDLYLTIEKLNQIGDDGWELVSYCTGFGAGHPVAIFEHPKN